MVLDMGAKQDVIDLPLAGQAREVHLRQRRQPRRVVAAQPRSSLVGAGDVVEALNRLAIDRKPIDRVPKLARRGRQKRRIRNVGRRIRERAMCFRADAAAPVAAREGWRC